MAKVLVLLQWKLNTKQTGGPSERRGPGASKKPGSWSPPWRSVPAQCPCLPRSWLYTQRCVCTPKAPRFIKNILLSVVFQCLYPPAPEHEGMKSMKRTKGQRNTKGTTVQTHDRHVHRSMKGTITWKAFICIALQLHLICIWFALRSHLCLYCIWMAFALHMHCICMSCAFAVAFALYLHNICSAIAFAAMQSHCIAC